MTSSGTMSSLLVAAPARATPPACPPSTTLYKDGRRSICTLRRRLSCKAASSGGGDLNNLDRRDVLAALMGLTAAGGLNPTLAAAAVTPADVSACKGNDVRDTLLHCSPKRDAVDGSVTSPLLSPPCPRPAAPAAVVDFTPPGGPMRVRKPAHLAEPELVEKYRLAVARMKALPEWDPRSFVSQARIHEAYCDAHYRLRTRTTAAATGGEEAPFDVHFSWIFAPWHRMYIHFYERILGHLIGDEAFALPYWNWDAPAGMVLPQMFRDGDARSNSLYDGNRNMEHVDKYVMLDFVHDVLGPHPKTPIPFDPSNPRPAHMNEIVKDNLSLIYHQMIRGGKGARCFHGEKFCTDDEHEPGMAKGTAGTLDRMAHTGVHIFLGDTSKCYRPPRAPDDVSTCGLDMGFLGRAAFDPVFYTHHANVDRMWHLWAHGLGPELNHRDFQDPAWLDTSFVFYDEKAQPVRVKVSDVLHTDALRYRFEEREPLLWENWRPQLINKNKPPLLGSTGTAAPPPPPKPPASWPLRLERGKSVVALVVDRPSKGIKGKPVSLLFDDSIQFDPTRVCKFDVVINVPLEQANDVSSQWVEYAGTFWTMQRSRPPFVPGHGIMPIPIFPRAHRTSLELPLEDVLDDIPVKEGAPIYVVLVPRTDGVTILEKPAIVPMLCDDPEKA